jgi:hypothetical protein
MKLFYILFFIFILCVQSVTASGGDSGANAADRAGLSAAPRSTVVSNGTGGGDWTNPLTWQGVLVPVDGDDVTILAGDSVTYDATGVTIAGLSVSGILQTSKTVATSLTVNGDLTITGTGGYKAQTNTIGGNLVHTLTLHGNLTNDGVVFDFRSGSANTTLSVINLVFAGSSNSTVAMNPAYSSSNGDFNGITINKSGTGRVLLSTDVFMNSGSTSALPAQSNLTFIRGIVETGSHALIHQSTTATTVSGASDSSYIIGAMGRGMATSGNTKEFYVGDEAGFRPVRVRSTTGVPSVGHYTLVRLVHGDADNGSSTFTGDIDAVSSVRYYKIMYYQGSTSTTSIDNDRWIPCYGLDDGVRSGNTHLRVAYSLDNRATWNGMTQLNFPHTTSLTTLPKTITPDSLIPPITLQSGVTELYVALADSVNGWNPLDGSTASLTITPAFFSFGNVGLALEETDSVVVSNNGNGPAVVSSAVSQSPSEFSVTPSGPVRIPANESRAFVISFHPGSLGLKSANIIFHHDAPGLHDTVAVNGSGIPSFTIAVTQSPNGLISPGTTIIAQGGSQTFAITPDPGFSIDSVLEDGVNIGIVSSHSFTNIQANHTLAAFYSDQRFRIVATAGSHGQVDPHDTVYVLGGDDRTFLMTPDPGYYVDSIVVDGLYVDSTSSYTFVNVQSDHTLRAKFAATQFAITATAGAHGSISPSGVVMADYGSDVTFTLLPDVGYLVDSIKVDGVYAGHGLSYTFSNVTGPHTITATFLVNVLLALYPLTDSIPDGVKDVPYSFTFLASGGFPPYVITANHVRANMSLSASGLLSGTPLTGSVDTTFEITVTDSRSVTVSRTYRWYVREPLRVTVSGAGSVQRNPNRTTYRHGETVQLTAVPASEQSAFIGWSGGATGTTNPITITVPDYQDITASFLLDSAYLVTYRSVPYDVWATEIDVKGKLRAIKRKPVRVDFVFSLVNDMPEATTLIVDFSIPVIPESVHTVPAYSCREVFPKSKRVSFCFTPGLSIGDTVLVSGRGIKGTYQKVSAYYWQRVDPILGPIKSERKKSAGVVMNVPRFPMPNLHNVGEELFIRSAFPQGLRIGIPRDARGAQSVVHLRYRDVLTSTSKKGTLHTGQPRCLAGFDNGTTISKQQKYLPFDKHNNALFAAALTLKLNLAASVMNQFPNGFGELTFHDQNDPSNPLNGVSVAEISVIADSMLSCMQIQSLSTQPTVGQLFNVIDNILHAFPGPVDTVAFYPWTVLNGVRPLMDVPYLHPTAGATPSSVPLPRENADFTPEHFTLAQNYPNPFNPTTTIQFSLPVSGYVTLTVFNLLGEKVGEPIHREFMEEGVEEVEFDGSDVASGVYFYRLVVEEQMDPEDPAYVKSFTTTRKMVLLK